jgi:hypothetical protein
LSAYDETCDAGDLREFFSEIHQHPRYLGDPPHSRGRSRDLLALDPAVLWTVPAAVGFSHRSFVFVLTPVARGGTEVLEGAGGMRAELQRQAAPIRWLLPGAEDSEQLPDSITNDGLVTALPEIEPEPLANLARVSQQPNVEPDMANERPLPDD